MRLPRIRLRSLATFLLSGGGVALVHALAGEKAAAGAGLIAGLVLSQSAPVVHAAPADDVTDGEKVQRAVAGATPEGAP